MRKKDKNKNDDIKFGFYGFNIVLWTKRINLTAIILIIGVVLFVSVVSYQSINNYRLNKSGKIVTASIIDAKIVGGKGIWRCFYSFKLNNKNFSGFYDNDSLNVGDSIKVLYLDKDPTINRPKNFIKK